MSGTKITKICCKCKKAKSLSKFYKRSENKNKYYNTCKVCLQQSRNERYKSTKKEMQKKVIKRRKYLALEIIKLKNIPCKDCNKIYDPCCMEFDHLIASDKHMSVSRMIHDNYSLENIKKEILKCELVCIMCHKIRTYNRLQDNKKQPIFYEHQKEIMYLAKSHPCAICGIQYDPLLMEFDHLRDKHKNVGNMRSYSDKKINEEINKCQVLCGICHRLKSRGKI